MALRVLQRPKILQCKYCVEEVGENTEAKHNLERPNSSTSNTTIFTLNKSIPRNASFVFRHLTKTRQMRNRETRWMMML